MHKCAVHFKPHATVNAHTYSLQTVAQQHHYVPQYKPAVTGSMIKDCATALAWMTEMKWLGGCQYDIFGFTKKKLYPQLSARGQK